MVDTIGLRDRLGHRPSELSGGQQQRVAGARALVSRPDIVFADEPTGNLDSRSGAELLGFLRDACSTYGQTIVMVTHDANAASYADRVVFLADGNVVDEMREPDRRRRARPAQVAGGLSAVWRATFKSLLAKKLRLVLTAISVVLGVGFVAGTYVLTDTMNAAFEDLFAQTSAASDVVVRSESAFDSAAAGPGGGSGSDDREPVPASVLDDVLAVPGVAVAVGDVQGYAQMIDPATDEVIGGVGPPTIGTNWNELAGEVLTLRGESEPPAGPDEVVIDAATARNADLAIGDRIRILFQGPPGEFTIVGHRGVRRSGQPRRRHARRLRHRDRAAGARQAGRLRRDQRRRRRRRGGERASGVGGRSAARRGRGGDVDVGRRRGLAGAAGRAGVLPDRAARVRVRGAVRRLVHHLQHVLDHRRAAHARARPAAGARARRGARWSVSVVLEAFLVGVVASVLGIALGIGIAVGLQGLLGAFNIDLPSTSLQLLPRTIVASLVVGIGVTVVASILPARRAASVAPIQALREAADGPTSKELAGRRLVVALVVTGARRRRAGLRVVRRPRRTARRSWGSGRRSRSSAWRCSRRCSARPVAGGLGRLRSSACRSRRGSGARTPCATRVAPPRPRRR